MLLKTAIRVIGVSEYEEFEVTQCSVTRTFRFTKDALEWWDGTKWVEDRDVLYEILNKECEVTFKEFVPLKGEVYYTYHTNTHEGWKNEIVADKDIWGDTFEDYLRLKQGVVFNNVLKAEFKKKEVLECIIPNLVS